MYRKLLYIGLFCILTSFTIDIVVEYQKGNALNEIIINSSYKNLDFIMSLLKITTYLTNNFISFIKKIINKINSYSDLFEPYDRTVRKLVISLIITIVFFLLYNFQLKMFINFLLVCFALIVVLTICSFICVIWKI
jgi:ABC-type multidrug transport system fused ATPase/permease subunit